MKYSTLPFVVCSIFLTLVVLLPSHIIVTHTYSLEEKQLFEIKEVI